jgi:hypothetical protein
MRTFHLFEVFGVELEYMVVDKDTLKVRPIVDLIIKEMTGEFTSDVERGDIAWSNELVAHVLELKTNGPSPSLKGLESRFHEEVVFLNRLLEKHNCMLLPTGAHPFFHPNQSVIWPHEYNEVYALYDRIFGCKGHGWSNLQSTHLNLPFANDAEFALLHAAIRVILPIIPALAASTPIIESKITGTIDTRLAYYSKNQSKIPEIAGAIIPEPAFSKAEYERLIFNPIANAIAPYDTEKVLDKHFLNSRGAIARFDRGAIEIRLIDIQECPKADLGIVELVVLAVKWLISKHEHNFSALAESCSTLELAGMLHEIIQNGSRQPVSNAAYLSLFDLKTPQTAINIWGSIFKSIETELSDSAKKVCVDILKHGNLSERLLKRIHNDSAEADIKDVYIELAACLAENRMFQA